MLYIVQLTVTVLRMLIMIGDTDFEVDELLRSCRCCLLRPPEKHLTTQYTNLGRTEIYLDILKDCFDVHLSSVDNECGICDVCVSRLRNANDFKQQVLSSQAELQATLQAALRVKCDDPMIWKELGDDILQNEPSVKEEQAVNEMAGDDPDEFDTACEESKVKVELFEAVTPSVVTSNVETEMPKKATSFIQRAVPSMPSLKFELDGSSGQILLPWQSASQKPTDSVSNENDIKQLNDSIIEEQVYLCDTCGKAYPTKADLIQHILQDMHQLEIKTIYLEKTYECETCGEEFESKHCLKKHQITHTNRTPYKCEFCKKQFMYKGKLKIHRCVNTKDIFQCDICNSHFRSEDGLLRHKKFHTGVKMYKCDVCPKLFTQAFNLKRHKTIHTGFQHYQCEDCEMTFPDHPTLKLHKQNHEDTAKALIYECNLCDRLFSSSSILSCHKRTHTGEKPYSCDVCNKVFSQKSNKARHMLTHADKKLDTHKEKTHQCEFCTKTFTSNSMLSAHIKTHSGERPYSCPVCHKRFSLKPNMFRHMSIHEKMHKESVAYKCDVCDKSFLTNSILALHIRTHTGEKPYDCEVCGRSFSQKPNMLRHRRTHKNKSNGIRKPKGPMNVLYI